MDYITKRVTTKAPAALSGGLTAEKTRKVFASPEGYVIISVLQFT
jgi:hypothetical protein